MSAARFIEIGGKRYAWRDLLRLRREQRKALAQAQQPAYFFLKDDRRPVAERRRQSTPRNRRLFRNFENPCPHCPRASPAQRAAIQIGNLQLLPLCL